MTERAPVILKIGGELLADATRRHRTATAIRRLAAAGPLVVVHGGGREVDAALATDGIEKRAIDGLRITDASTLEVVVRMLAGQVNTRLVAAVRHLNVAAVGLTAADTGVAVIHRAAPYVAANGHVVDLGFVGEPTGQDRPALLDTLYRNGFVPLVASIGVDNGQLLNVNADTLAGYLAGRLGATRLLIAGGTAGVLDSDGSTIPTVDDTLLQALIADGRANAGMVAKLMACVEARRAGINRVDIVDGTAGTDFDKNAGTQIVASEFDNTTDQRRPQAN